MSDRGSIDLPIQEGSSESNVEIESLRSEDGGLEIGAVNGYLDEKSRDDKCLDKNLCRSDNLLSSSK